MSNIRSKDIVFSASDGWQLAGSLFVGENPQIGIMISAGTAFPRRFYRHIAQYFASRGAVVLTYDYRGIADSANEDLANSTIEYHDWGRLDKTAALNRLEFEAPGLPLTHVAHSVGGHFIGLMPNYHKIARHAFLSVGTGTVWKHHPLNIPLELAFWWLLGPYSLWRHGYIKPGGGWTGEAIPPRVFKTWRRWCNTYDYFKSEIDTTLSPQHYPAVTAPINSWVFSDDPIATPRTTRELLALYPNAAKSIVSRKPNDYGLKKIGHSGAFRVGCEALWEDCWLWLSSNE